MPAVFDYFHGYQQLKAWLLQVRIDDLTRDTVQGVESFLPMQLGLEPLSKCDQRHWIGVADNKGEVITFANPLLSFVGDYFQQIRFPRAKFRAKFGQKVQPGL